MQLVRLLSTRANSFLGMCSYTVRQARSATGATPDAFQVGATSTTAGRVGLANCAAAMLIIPNSAVQAPEYCGAFLVNKDADTKASPVTGKIYNEMSNNENKTGFFPSQFFFVSNIYKFFSNFSCVFLNPNNFFQFELYLF